MCIKTKETIILEIGEIQEGDENEIEKELKIELTDMSAIFYLDDVLLGSFDIKHIYTFSDKLKSRLDMMEKNL